MKIFHRSVQLRVNDETLKPHQNVSTASVQNMLIQAVMIIDSKRLHSSKMLPDHKEAKHVISLPTCIPRPEPGM